MSREDRGALWHCFRHTLGTRMREAGASWEAISFQLGHRVRAGGSIITAGYVHDDAMLAEEAEEMIEAAMRPGPGGTLGGTSRGTSENVGGSAG